MANRTDESILGNPNATVILLNGFIQRISLYVQHLDIKSNITVAISTAIFVFSGSNLVHQTPDNLSWSMLILALSSGLSAIIALLAINPPWYMRHRGQSESLFYHAEIADYSSFEEYFRHFHKILKSEEDYAREATRDIYNICRYSYLPKKNLYNRSRDVLIIGLFLSFIVFALHMFIKLY